MSEDIEIHGYATNGPKDKKPREPLVHMMASRYGDVQSISFHPDDAPLVADAILAAGRAATRDRDRKITVALQHSE